MRGRRLWAIGGFGGGTLLILFGVAARYLGATSYQLAWPGTRVDGSLEALDCTVEYRRGGKVLAVVTIGRDLASLEAEARMERGAS